MRKRGKWIPILTAVIGVIHGCGSSASAPEKKSAEVTKTSEDAGVIKVPKDRADCLKPPWTPAGSSDGLRVSQCDDERVYRFVLGAGSPASDKVEESFLNAHRDEFHAVDGIVASAFGLCCNEDKVVQNELCLVFDLRVCSTPLPKFIDKVRELAAADRNVADHSLRVVVGLQGPTEPRCKAGDDACGPLPYSDQGAQTPPKNRTPVDPVKRDSLACSYDGECVANGCGNECDHWTLGGAPGTCPYIGKLEGAFCGCVEERCAWFH